MRKIRISFFAVLSILSPGLSRAQAQDTTWRTTQVPAHDPVMIRQDSVYYAFFTGFGISAEGLGEEMVEKLSMKR